MKKKEIFQAMLVIALVLIGVRLYLILSERRVTFKAPAKTEAALDPDYYVTPKKLHPQDLQDAKELIQKTVWVREGYRNAYYNYGPPIDIRHLAGRLGPIEKLEIKDVVMQGKPGLVNRQVMAVFEKEGKPYAFSIGVEDNGSYSIYSDDILFIEDPHELYKHWPPDVWKAIESHQVKTGMNELQASFAIGVGIPEGTGRSNPKVVNYPNNGHPVKVTYQDGKAIDVVETNS